MWSELARTAKDYRVFNDHCSALGVDPLNQVDQQQIVNEEEYVVNRFGPEIKNDWGWASPFLPGNPKRPTFTALEKSVGMQAWQIQVSGAHHAVHGGFKGMMSDIGAGPERYSPVMLSGPSMEGIEFPIMSTIQTLTQCTSIYARQRGDFQDYIHAAALVHVEQRAIKSLQAML
jgi:hypothetical protein